MTYLAESNAITLKTQYSQAFCGQGVSKPQQQPSFRGEPALTPELKADTVELSAKDNVKKDTVDDKTKDKKGMSTGAKWAVGIGGTLTALVTAGLLVARHDHKKLLNLCKDKIKLSNLPEHLEYNATTREEAMKFAKETLGIKEVDTGFSDLALHDTLKAIVDVSNANKGKVYITPSLKFIEMPDGVLASANHLVKTNSYGQLCINKKYYDDEYLTKILKEYFGIAEEKSVSKAAKSATESTSNGTKEDSAPIILGCSSKYIDFVKKLKQTPEALTLEEKRELFLAHMNSKKHALNLVHNSKAFFRACKNLFDEVGIKYDYDAILKLSEAEQIKELEKLRVAYKAKTGECICVPMNATNPHETIYHEMGHLQDFTQNLENLILKDSAWSRFKRIFTSRRNDLKIKNKDELEFVGSRWNKISNFSKGEKAGLEIINEKPDYYKQVFPDLYEHITNKEIQMTAGEVSSYAKEGVGEFVAEVYAKMINGEKLSDDVLALYKKYNGPMPASYLK